MPLPRRRFTQSRRAHRRAASAAAAPAGSDLHLSHRYVSERLEARVLLSAASIYDVTPAPQPYGPRPVVFGTATARPLSADAASEPIASDSITPSAVSGIVYQNLDQGSGFLTWGDGPGVIGFDDYNSINDASIRLSEFTFIGGVNSAGGTLEFEFLNTSSVQVVELIASLPQAGSFIWTIGIPSPVTIPDAGFLRIRAQSGSFGHWFFSDAQPTIGTQSNSLGDALTGNSYKFELVNTPLNIPPTIASLSDTPDPVAAGADITLTANAVNDTDGTIADVRFYRETNGIAGLQTSGGGGIDLLLATDSTGPDYDAIVSTAGLTNGNYTYYAQATDSGGEVGNVVSTTNTVGVGSISGVVWDDADGNGSFDAGESALPNWTVYLDQDRDQTLDAAELSTTTDASGAYTFNNLAADTYFVTAEIPAGWTQTSPGATGQISPAAMGNLTAEAAPIVPPAISTTASTVPIYPSGGFASNTATATTSSSSGTTITPQDAQSTSLIRLNDFQADPRFSDIRGQGFSVAVLDTGIDLDHPFFGPDAVAPFGIADRIIYHQDFANGDMDATDHDDHGTNVASIVGSQNGTHPGMAPEVDLIALKVFTDAGAGNFAYVEAALQWVIANAATFNIATVNMSLGDNGNYASATTETAIGINDELATLAAMNVLVVSAAGNDFFVHNSNQGVAYPAADPNSLAVSAVYDADVGGPVNWSSGATDNTTGPDRVAAFSQRSTMLTDIFAPGPMSTGGNQSGGTVTMGGTSQAAPHIAGIAALAQQLAARDLGRRLTLAEFRALLASTGVTINDGDDEDDNVTNTGTDFPRVDVLALGEAIRALAVSPFTHTVNLGAGENVSGIDFGNQSSDLSPPTADVIDVTPDPRLTTTGSVTVSFSEAVVGVDISDFSLMRDGASIDIAAAPFAQVDPAQYTIDLTSFTGEAGKYVLTLHASGSGIEDAFNNALLTDAADEWIRLSIDGTAGDDTIRLVRNNGAIDVFINNPTATPTYSVNIANLGANVLHVQGLAGNDTIEIDFTGPEAAVPAPSGAPAPAAGLSVLGGDDTTGDTLILIGTDNDDIATFTVASFNLGGTLVGYTDVEHHVFNGGAGADTLNVESGLFQFDADANVGTDNLSIDIDAAGTVHFNASQHLDALTVDGQAELAAGDSKLLVVNALSVTGQLNLRNHDAIVRYGSSDPSPIGASDGATYDGLTGAIAGGRNGGAWNGFGLVTTEADAADGRTTLGIAEAADVLNLSGDATTLWNGETLDATTVLIKYTWAGDANLDGFVSGDDYTAIDFAIATAGAFGHANGDFNLDGIISGDDYTVIDFMIAAQGLPL